MKSNICEIKKENTDLSAILTEVEKIAVYSALDRKQALRLRLLAEELIGMVPELLDICEGRFWAEAQEKEIGLYVQLDAMTMNTDLRDELIDISKSKKNAAAKGIMGKIRSVVDYMLYPNQAVAYSTSFVSGGFVEASALAQSTWTLNQYKGSVNTENEEAWDELEKSIVANLADDVIVGIKGRQVQILIKKSFA